MLKRFLIIFLPIVIILAGISGVAYYQENKSLLTLIKAEETSHINYQLEIIGGTLKRIKSDIIILSELHELQELANNLEGYSREELEKDFISFSLRIGDYDQIRFINTTGKEIVRVNYNNGKPYIVPEDQLQNKAHRYYFTKTLEMEVGKLYATPLDLNIEKGRIEQPLNPVLRIGTPVSDSTGKKRGVLIVNFIGIKLFESIKRGFAHTLGHITLLNLDGYWLLGLQPEDEWGFLLEDRKNKTFQSLFPLEWQKIKKGEKGQLKSKNGLFTFGTVYPSLDNRKPGLSWKIVSIVMPDFFKMRSQSFLIKLAWINVMVIGMFAVGAWFTAKTHIQRKQAEKNLRTSEERYRLLVEGERVILWEYDPNNDCFTFVSGRAKEISGYSPEEWYEKGFWASHIHPHDRKFATEYRSNHTVKCQDHEFEYRMLSKSGPYIWVKDIVQVQSYNGNPVKLRGVCIDVSSEKKAELELKKLANVIEQSDDLIIITDKNGVIQHVNHILKERTLYSPAEVIGKSTKIFKSGTHGSAFYNNMWNTITQGKIWRGRIVNKKKNGELYTEDTTIAPVKDEQGEICHFVSIKHDVTRQIKTEQELEVARNFAEKSAHEAKQANKAKSEFLANMSHELRTPLNGILGMADLLLHSIDEAGHRKKLELIRFSGESLLNLVNDILDLSKIEERKLSIANMEFNLHELIKRTIEQHAVLAQKKCLELKFSICKDVPVHLLGDPRRLNQIIVNLLGNAIKFTSDGAVVLECGLWDEEFGMESPVEKQYDMCMVHFSIRDTGIGIPKEKQDIIFERFAQSDSTTTRLYAGSGLGTTISRELVQMMGGRIWLKSEVDKGSVFHFTAGFGIVKDPAGVPFAPSKNQPLAVAGTAFSILQIEDNPVNQEVTKSALELLGHHVDLAKNGKEGLEKWGKGAYDLILMDIQMPDIDGFEATRIIRNLENNTQDYKNETGKPKLPIRIPILAMTAHAMLGDREKCLRAGMDDYISQPITLERLRARISRIIGAQTAGALSEKKEIKLEFREENGPDYDLANVRVLLNNDEIRVKKLLQKFIKTTVNNISGLEKAIGANDLAKIQILAHTIKGSAAQIYATDLRQIAFDLEGIGNEKKLDGAMGKLTQLKKVFKELKKKIIDSELTSKQQNVSRSLFSTSCHTNSSKLT